MIRYDYMDASGYDQNLLVSLFPVFNNLNAFWVLQ